MKATLRLREANLAKIRKWTGLTTNAALADAMGIDPGNLSRILQGKQQPGVNAIGSLCTALKCEMDDLFEVVADDVADAA